MCDIPLMRITITIIALSALLPILAFAGQEESRTVYKWVDKDGNVHLGDSVPAEFAELEQHLVNEVGVTVEVMRGKKTKEELAEERRQQAMAERAKLQRRADAALLATYLTIDEIVMHRDRRIELFQAQARVTELYLSNIKRRLNTLMAAGAKYSPYSTNPDAEMIDPGLASDINDTRATIDRHETNLRRFQTDEQEIMARFDGDINRFKALKGLE